MAMLEGRCAFEAARKASDAELAALEPLHAELAGHAKAGRIDAYYQTNYLIHEAVQALSGNQWLTDMPGAAGAHRTVLRRTPGHLRRLESA
ncbi:hypothetical protein G6F58_013400 [Rhizopus delemar]|nr:hypothetical protein G6F58_013400 [Rhizopus delemar]